MISDFSNKACRKLWAFCLIFFGKLANLCLWFSSGLCDKCVINVFLLSVEHCNVKGAVSWEIDGIYYDIWPKFTKFKL